MKAAAMKEGVQEEPVPDALKYGPICAMLYAFFLPVMVLVFLETIGVPFVSDQYGWDDDKAVTYVGIFLCIGGFGMMILFYLSTVLAKIIDERIVLILFGIVPISLGCILFMPFGHNEMVLQECNWDLSNSTISTYDIGKELNLHVGIHNETNYIVDEIQMYFTSTPLMSSSSLSPCSAGCPATQVWCKYVPQLALPQMIIAGLFLMAGFPMAQSITLGIYSKLIGHRPQGLWMALLTLVGTISRVVGPITVGYLYTNFGTYWTFGTLSFFMCTLLVLLYFIYDRIKV